jgi:hypothetical protein
VHRDGGEAARLTSSPEVENSSRDDSSTRNNGGERKLSPGRPARRGNGGIKAGMGRGGRGEVVRARNRREAHHRWRI